ncbi:MAG TPA: hypothetical protein VKB88_43725 [Bryobacteraceae bacterium]|nr:hypothetical protein [Bryobacteraceae bacterium]
MNPKAIRNLAMVRGTDGLLRLEMADVGRKVVLDPLAELVWDLSDGSRSMEDLAQSAGRTFDRAVPKEEVFSALDFLADAGLLEERIAPPVAVGNVSRRSLLVRIAPIVAPAAWMMSGASRAGGFQESSTGAEAAQKANNAAEQGRKNALEDAAQAENKERDDKLEKKIDEAGRRSRIENQPHGGIVKDPGGVVTGKYRVAPDHRLVGKWKYVKYFDWARELLAAGRCNETCISYTLVHTFHSSGIMEARQSSSSHIWEAQVNWKYTSTGPGTGVLEEFQVLRDFQEETLRWRGDIRWISGNEFEYTTTFAWNDFFLHRQRFVREETLQTR